MDKLIKFSNTYTFLRFLNLLVIVLPDLNYPFKINIKLIFKIYIEECNKLYRKIILPLNKV